MINYKCMVRGARRNTRGAIIINDQYARLLHMTKIGSIVSCFFLVSIVTGVRCTWCVISGYPGVTEPIVMGKMHRDPKQLCLGVARKLLICLHCLKCSLGLCSYCVSNEKGSSLTLTAPVACKHARLDKLHLIQPSKHRYQPTNRAWIFRHLILAHEN